MGSGTGAKWLIVILIYFAMMITIVSVVELTSNTVVSQDDTIALTSCGSPRDIYSAYNPYPIDLSEQSSRNLKYLGGHIDCALSKGVYSQNMCESLPGCSWTAPTFLWFDTADETCIGQLNYTFINTYGIDILFFQGAVINTYENALGENTNFICTHPAVIGNKTLCDSLSCTWMYRTNYAEFDVSDIEPGIGMLGTMWSTTKNLATFKFDLGFTDEILNFILYFLMFWLPLIGLGLAIYVMVRS